MTPGTGACHAGCHLDRCALCYVATMAIYYARIFDAGVELENEVRRRRLATDKLRAAIVAADEAGIPQGGVSGPHEPRAEDTPQRGDRL